MRYLLDTHTLIWAITDPDKLSDKVRRILESAESHIAVSAISFWEISLKFSIGKLVLENIIPEDFLQLCRQMDMEIIAVDAVICSTYHHLQPLYHRDPFDRMLLWLAKSEHLTILSKDETMKQYASEGISVVW
ncbi:MAG: type II toxin-antitoxin system VapC family toxin [Saprospiraceae bacterium]|nr:type II toxin-antitoxin system VapC family toxin [Saprospiraceae bacterium]